MRATRFPADHPPVAAGRIGVLLVNLGTPEGTELLADAALSVASSSPTAASSNGRRSSGSRSCRGSCSPCARRRAARSTPRSGTRSGTNRRFAPSRARRRRSLPAELASEEEVDRRLGDALRQPDASPSGCDALAKAGARARARLPALSAIQRPTTATVNDKAFDALKAMRWQPALRTVPPYHDEPVYIDALAESDRERISRRSTSSRRS